MLVTIPIKERLTIAWKKLDGNICYILFCMALLPILFLRDFTPLNELRYLSIADEALRNHTFFTFTNHGEPYADKPPLYFWFVMLGKWLWGSHQMWFLSLASLVPTIVIVRTMDKWTATELDVKSRDTARIMLITCGLFAGLAVTLRMDMLMCMFIVLALRSFYRMAVLPDVSKREAWLFPLYIFLALFSKGPVGLLVPLCSTIVFLLWERKIRQWGKYWGWRTWRILLAGCLIWFCAVYIEGGKDYLDNLLFHQTVDRAVNSFHHKEPFWYYGGTVWYSIAPWTLLIIGTIVTVIGKRLISTHLQRFLCSVVLATFVMLSCISSKIQIYLLPAFPFMVYLAAMYISRFKEKGWLNTLFAISAVLFVLTLPIVVYLSSHEDMRYLKNGLVYTAATVLALSGIVALWFCYRLMKDLYVGIRVLATGLLFAIFIGGWALPYINPWIVYKALCQKAQEIAREKKAKHIAVWRVARAENMDTYLGTPIEIIKDNDTEALRLSHGTVLMLRQRDLKEVEGKAHWIVGRFAVVLLE